LAALSAKLASGAFQPLKGNVTFTLADSTLATKAKTDFGAFLSLVALSPLVISTTNGDAIAALKTANAVLTEKWEADTQLNADERSKGLANFSDSYFTDRAAMLGWLVNINKTDSLATESHPYAPDVGLGLTVVPPQYFADVASGDKMYLGGQDRRYFVFGSDQGEAIYGRGYNDHLYGGAGADTINGSGGADYIEGGAGDDILTQIISSTSATCATSRHIGGNFLR
jgi:Ca2+-binding RTX toxin-like protein